MSEEYIFNQEDLKNNLIEFKDLSVEDKIKFLDLIPVLYLISKDKGCKRYFNVFNSQELIFHFDDKVTISSNGYRFNFKANSQKNIFKTLLAQSIDVGFSKNELIELGKFFQDANVADDKPNRKLSLK